MPLITMEKIGIKPIELVSRGNRDWFHKYGAVLDNELVKVLNGIWYYIFLYGWSVGHRNNMAVDLVAILEYFGCMPDEVNENFVAECMDILWDADDKAKDYYISHVEDRRYQPVRVTSDDVGGCAGRENVISQYTTRWLRNGIYGYIIEEDFFEDWDDKRIEDDIVGPLFILHIED